MSAGTTGAHPDDGPAPNRRARALTLLYPPAWRARYATEFTALAADTGVGVREIADVVPAAAAAWVRPVARLHDRAGRLRATVGVTVCAWAALAAGSMLFAKTTRDGALYVVDHARPVVGWLYDGYALAAFGSVLAMLVGGLPLTVTMLRTARRASRHRRRVLALLGVPPAAVLGFLGLTYAVTGLLRPDTSPGNGIGAGWFVALSVAGLAAAAGCAAAPATALARIRPDGPTLTVAVVAGSCATALMAVAMAASLGGQLLGHPDGAHSAVLTGYATAMAAALLAATTSCARGLRAVRSPAVRGGRAR